jgi:hypothetical protein
MTENSHLHYLAPIGYLILQKAEEARLTNEYRRAFGPYYGVDRLPPLFPPDALIRNAIGEAPVQDERLGTVIEEWLDARFGSTAFIPNGSQAVRLLQTFHRFGYRFELVYCQLAWKDREGDRLIAYARTDETPFGNPSARYCSYHPVLARKTESVWPVE